MYLGDIQIKYFSYTILSYDEQSIPYLSLTSPFVAPMDTYIQCINIFSKWYDLQNDIHN